MAAGNGRVVAAIEDPKREVAGQGHAKLRAAGIAVDIGLAAAEAARDHAGHFRRVRDRRAHVILKLAVSPDGKIGGAPASNTPDVPSRGDTPGDVFLRAK